MKSTIEREVKYVEAQSLKLFYFIISVLIAIVLLKPEYFTLIEKIIVSLNNYGIIGIFWAGSGYTFSFTTPISAIVLYAFGQFYNPFFVALIGATGSLFVDSIMFFISRKTLKNIVGKKKFKTSFIHQSKLLRKLAPFIGFFIIASPLPDELGAAFLSIFEKRYRDFAIISYLGNFTGILFFALLGSV